MASNGLTEAAREDSDSEEDLDYNPTQKEIAEAEREEQRHKRQKLDPEEVLKARKASAKVEDIWQRLKSSTPAAGNAAKLSYAAISAGTKDSGPTAIPASEREWMRQFGISTVVPQIRTSLPKSKPKVQSAEGQSSTEKGNGSSTQISKGGLSDRALDIGLAAKALALAKGGISSIAAEHGDKIAVTEVRRFAGKDVLVSKMATKEEAEKLKQKAEQQKSGLDSVLASLQSTKKITVMDKTRDEWTDLKKSDAELEKELEEYKKSSGQYLGQKDFLDQAKYNEYQIQRDQRLQMDMNTRGRT